MISKVRINQGRYFDSFQRISISVIIFLTVVSLTIWLNNELGFAICLSLGILLLSVWSTLHILILDPETKVVERYISLFGIPINRQVRHYDVFLGIRLEKNPETELRDKDFFVANLIVLPEEKVFLASDDSKEALKKRLNPVLKKLGVSILS